MLCRRFPASVTVDGASRARMSWLVDAALGVPPGGTNALTTVGPRRGPGAVDPCPTLSLDNCPDPLVVLDPGGMIRYVNVALADLLGVDPSRVIDRPARHFVHPADRHLTRLAPVEAPAPPRVRRVRLRRPGGGYGWYEARTTGRFDRTAGGLVVGLRAAGDDHTDRARLDLAPGPGPLAAVVATFGRLVADLAVVATHEARRNAELRASESRLRLLAAQATKDPLTGLANRARLDDHLERVADQPTLCVFLIDLDGFKRVNDTHGHSVGDQVLRVVATRLRQAARCDDLVVRYGGDEFIVVTEDLNAAGALRLGDRIVAALSVPIALNGLAIAIGASVGVAVAGGAGLAADRLLGAADSAMYRAKREGKGTVRLAAVAR